MEAARSDRHADEGDTLAHAIANTPDTADMTSSICLLKKRPAHFERATSPDNFAPSSRVRISDDVRYLSDERVQSTIRLRLKGYVVNLVSNI